jgi:hypothetical protein
VDYKAGIQNWDIVQDKRGLIYVANNFGLLEFDGNEWETYPVKNQTKVRCLAIDGSGRIYAGSQGDFGYFFPDNKGKLTYTSLADSLPSDVRNFDETWNIYTDDNLVYFCTFSRIYIYDGKRIETIDPKQNINISFYFNHQLYITEATTGISALRGSKFEPVTGASFFRRNSISSIIPFTDGALMISTFQDGIFTLRSGKITPWNPSMQNTFREANINCMIRLRNGQYATGTQNNGLLILNSNGSLAFKLTRGSGLDNRTVLNIFEDDLNNLWIGQNNVLSYAELGSPFTLIDEQSGLPGTGYAALLNGNELFLATNTGLYARANNSTATYGLIENSQGQVYHIGKYDDQILIGHHLGAFRLEGRKLKQLSSEPGSWVFLPLEDKRHLIEGTYSGLQLYENTSSGWKLVKKLEGFNESSRIMSQDADGFIWVTHGYKGAYRLRLSESAEKILEVKYYGPEQGFPSNRLINVFKINGNLIFTGEQGIYKYDKASDRFIPEPLLSKLLGVKTQIWYLQADDLGNIYFVGREKIGMLRQNARGEYELDAKRFNRIRKYLNDDLENITILRNNQVLFGSREGFIQFNPTAANPPQKEFKALIRQVSASGPGNPILFFGNYTRSDSVISSQLREQQPRLEYKNNALKFTFTATTYEGNADQSFRYYLYPYEKEWSAWGTQPSKEYTNLKEGNYTFHVQARNVNEEISPEETYRFSIAPPWYRNILAYILYVTCIMALIMLGFQLLRRRYKRQQRILTLRQRKELNRKEFELNMLSKQSQEQISRLETEKLESELRHKNNELATSTMNLLNKNEFINHVRQHILSLSKSNNAEEISLELTKISQDIEKNISADADWEHFAFHFDQVHGDFSSRFKVSFPQLSPQEIKLSAYLRMNLSTKEIAQLLNISVRGVEIGRYRLRKKMNLDRNQNLQEFILNF